VAWLLPAAAATPVGAPRTTLGMIVVVGATAMEKGFVPAAIVVPAVNAPVI